MVRKPRTDYCAWASREPHCGRKPLTKGGLCEFHEKLTIWWKTADHDARIDLMDDWADGGEAVVEQILGVGAALPGGTE